MHELIVVVGVLLVIIVAVHLLFSAIKFTLSVLLLGIALIGIVYGFQEFFGIDLLSVISSHIN